MTKRKSDLAHGGIFDWELKVLALRRIFGAFTYQELFKKILEGSATETEVKARAEELALYAHKWNETTPLQHSEFLNQLVERIGCPKGTTGMWFVTATIAEFINALPKEIQSRADLSPSTHATETFSRVIQLHHTDETCTMAAGVRSGNLDTRHYYNNADGAETWERLVSADRYRGYDECKAGLRDLMTNDEWKKALESAPPAVAVMLGGGGSPTKDLVLARALLEHTSASRTRVTIVIVDINPYMIIQSDNFLRRAMQDVHDHERLEFAYAKADILRLGSTHQPLFTRNGPAVFAITGGTIGNLSERVFFDSLNQIAQTGDLLIVSADTVDNLRPDELKAKLSEKYDHPDMKRLIRPGVVAVLSELNIQEPVDRAMKRIKPDVKPNHVEQLSDVPESWNVTLNLTAGNRKVTLVRSTRYAGDSLIEFARQFNWEPICSVGSPLNPHFVQFAFRRK